MVEVQAWRAYYGQIYRRAWCSFIGWTRTHVIGLVLAILTFTMQCQFGLVPNSNAIGGFMSILLAYVLFLVCLGCLAVLVTPVELALEQEHQLEKATERIAELESAQAVSYEEKQRRERALRSLGPLDEPILELVRKMWLGAKVPHIKLGQTGTALARDGILRQLRDDDGETYELIPEYGPAVRWFFESRDETPAPSS